MTTAALITMITTMTIVISITVSFFIKVLRTPPRKDEA